MHSWTSMVSNVCGNLPDGHQVGSVFNDPLVHRMANTCIKDSCFMRFGWETHMEKYSQCMGIFLVEAMFLLNGHWTFRRDHGSIINQ